VAAVWFGNDDYRPTKNLTGGSLPAQTWQKFMAYAHTNAEIKPVFGVDFAPAEPVVIVADADPAAAAPVVPQVERPPTLKPEAARKLLDVADRLKEALGSNQVVADQAALAAPAPSQGL